MPTVAARDTTCQGVCVTSQMLRAESTTACSRGVRQVCAQHEFSAVSAIAVLGTPLYERNGEGRNRTGDTTIFSRSKACDDRAPALMADQELPASRAFLALAE